MCPHIARDKSPEMATPRGSSIAQWLEETIERQFEQPVATLARPAAGAPGTGPALRPSEAERRQEAATPARNRLT